MARGVFVYGTLLLPQMMQAVAGRALRSAAATLDGYARFAIRDRCYPGITPAAGSAVEGRVYLEVDAEVLARLDYFEGPEYVRQEVAVRLAGGESLAAWTYVVPAERRAILTKRAWALDRFCNEDAAAFVEHARECMARYPAARPPMPRRA